MNRKTERGMTLRQNIAKARKSIREFEATLRTPKRDARRKAK